MIRLSTFQKQSLLNRLIVAIGISSCAGVLLILAYLIVGTSESYPQGFDAGDRNVDMANCWTFSSVAVRTANGNGNLINGPSARTGQLTNMSNPQKVGTPCSRFTGTGSLEFTHYVHSLSGSSLKQLDVVAIDQSTLDEVTLYAHTYTSTSLVNVSVPITLNGDYKIEWRWIGSGGIGRGWLDDISIPGQNISVPGSGCVCNNSSLPVEWSYFDAKMAQEEVALTWGTLKEMNTDYFEIERALDGSAFEAVGQVAAAGNSSSSQEYSWSDQPIVPGGTVLQYRLKQIDQDGKYSYSKQVEIVTSKREQADIKVYPNPTNTGVNLRITAPVNELAEVRITNMNGVVMMNEQISLDGTEFSLPVDISQWAAGYSTRRF
ncbi:MAG: T9SS type A sorting domain-containing protein [Bacteroidota bacterium]